MGIRKTPTRKILTHQAPHWKIPTRKIPTQKIPTWNIPTHVSKIFPPEFLNFLFFHYCHCHHWHYLKDCFVILCFKSAEVRNSEVDVSKKLKLAGPSLIIGHYYYALVLLDDFAFEASHEECDVTKCNQLNGAGWILPGKLSSLTSPPSTTSAHPPFHLTVPVECRLMNLKII